MNLTEKFSVNQIGTNMKKVNWLVQVAEICDKNMVTIYLFTLILTMLLKQLFRSDGK